jgi:hypothetical protein
LAGRRHCATDRVDRVQERDGGDARRGGLELVELGRQYAGGSGDAAGPAGAGEPEEGMKPSLEIVTVRRIETRFGSRGTPSTEQVHHGDKILKRRTRVNRATASTRNASPDARDDARCGIRRRGPADSLACGPEQPPLGSLAMQSRAIDELLSQYLAMPARVSWKGALGDSMRGTFVGGRLELAGVAVLALPCQRLVLESERFQFTPGIPARIQAIGPRVELTIEQSQIDRWLKRSRAPFTLVLLDEGIELSLDVRGLPVTRAAASLEIDRGWFVLRPKHASLFGLQNHLAALFRTYFPMPRLAPETRLSGIRHRRGSIVLELSLGDFEEDLSPGLVDRLQRRFLPMPQWLISGRG